MSDQPRRTPPRRPAADRYASMPPEERSAEPPEAPPARETGRSAAPEPEPQRAPQPAVPPPPAVFGGELAEAQVRVLLGAINPDRVFKLDDLSHMAAWDVRAHLNRVFGFCGWDELSLEPTTLLYEQETMTKGYGDRPGKPAYKVAYRASRRLVIRGPRGGVAGVYEATAVGEAVMPDFKRGDAHDMAIKTAESQALKRCCINLGDQFGLSLYNQGSMQRVVRGTLVRGFDGKPPEDDDAPAAEHAELPAAKVAGEGLENVG